MDFNFATVNELRRLSISSISLLSTPFNGWECCDWSSPASSLGTFGCWSSADHADCWSSDILTKSCTSKMLQPHSRWNKNRFSIYINIRISRQFKNQHSKQPFRSLHVIETLAICHSWFRWCTATVQAILQHDSKLCCLEQLPMADEGGICSAIHTGRCTWVRHVLRHVLRQGNLQIHTLWDRCVSNQPYHGSHSSEQSMVINPNYTACSPVGGDVRTTCTTSESGWAHSSFQAEVLPFSEFARIQETSHTGRTR